MRDDLGPLEGLLADESVSAILVNGPSDVYVERNDTLVRADVKFIDADEILGVILGVAHRLGRPLDESSPMLDARLPDGTIVNAIVPPLAVDGPVLSLRRPHASVSLEQLVATRSLNRVAASFLTACVRAKCAVLVAGTAGSGKSTMLQALVGCIPPGERVMTIEDVPELRRGNRKETVRLEMPAETDASARGDVMSAAVRMRADRLVLGDLRSAEAAALIEALSTDTDGALVSMHAASPLAALERIETLVLEQNPGTPFDVVRRKIVQAIDLVVQVAQLPDRTRRLISVAEPSVMADGQFAIAEIFVFEQTDNGAGRWVASGVKPRVLDRVARAGITVPDRIFDQSSSRPAEAGTAELHSTITRQEQELTQLRAQLEVLRAEVDALRKPREARLGALLSVVDVADALSRYPIADEQMRVGVAALQTRIDAMLQGIGFEPVAVPGMSIDEHSHEVVGEVDIADAAPRSIAAVRRRGFRAQGEVIRKASVIATR
jgi:pilus assembly protein CpaF